MGFIPICDLNEFDPVPGVGIRARVTAKGKIRRTIHGFEDGDLRVVKKYFVVHLIDESEVEIAAIAFDGAASANYDFLEEGIVYEFYDFKVRLVQEDYRSNVLSPYEIILGNNTDICIPYGKFKFIPDMDSVPITPIKQVQYLYDGDTVGKF